MNKVNLIGRLGHDVDLRYTPDQLAVARFSIAVNRPGKDNGTDWLDCVSFGKQAETISKYCSKGSLIGVSGRVQVDSYEKDGINRRKWEIRLDTFGGCTFCDGRKETEAKPEQGEQVEGFKQADDDIPF